MKPREVVIVSKLEKILKNYIKDKKDYEYMVPSRKGNYDHIGVQRVSKISKEAVEVLDSITLKLIACEKPMLTVYLSKGNIT